jgi:glutamate--cysteine ligase
MNRDQAVLRSAFAEAGLGLVFLGADPLRPPKRINPGSRYRAMEQFFAASRSGDAGAAMMTSTASIQVNLDAGPQDGWAARVRLAHALGPTMIAIAANSPMLCGEFTGWVSTRQRVWGQMDSARCGPILGASGDDPGTDWARYALKAPVMLVHNPDAVAVTQWVPFADWVDGRALLGDRRPTIADLEYHLTTLFPPVRPRQWLEIRYLDSMPDAFWPAVVFMLVALLDDPVAADIAAEAVEPVATAWDAAARVGLRDRRLYAAANKCVAVAAEKAPTGLTDVMQRLIRCVEQGRCPGDDYSDQVIEHGIAAMVARLAQGGL